MNSENKKNNNKMKKGRSSVWLGLAVMLISASTSGCYAWVRWGIV
ncbi:uncharacterized protein METZ01_LOCUS425723 [marine metagenome]|uniref:Lipoprotein n=1 Tax=marine metagenome TaxID=408172 RepID=A0A382XPU4_9ZZZZ